jgi:hypothetical protein
MSMDELENRKAVRTWKRDRTRNVMPLSSAVENLRRNGVDVHGQGKDTIAERLVSGSVLETPLAEFRIAAEEA